MTAAAAALIVKRSAATLGVDLPAGFLTALDAAANLVERAENLGENSGQRLRAAVLDCLQQHEGDVHADKNIARALLDFQLSNIGAGEAARQLAARNITSALVEFGDEILAAFSTVMEPHLADLSAAAADMPVDDPIADSASFISRGGAALRAWATATDALRLTDAALDGVSAIAGAAHVTVTRDRRPVLWTDPDFDGFNQIVKETGRPVDVWATARHGLSLRLVDSVAELLERIAGVDAQRQALIDSEAERQKHLGRKAAVS